MDGVSDSNNVQVQVPTFMGCSSFISMESFRDRLQRYQRQTGTAFLVDDSQSVKKKRSKSTSEAPEYYRVKYLCVHNGKRLREPSTPGKRCYADYNCEATIVLVFDAELQRMKVSEVNLRHSHDIQKGGPEVYSGNRHLTPAQQDMVYRLIDNQYSTMELKKYIKENYDVLLTSDDIKYLRSRYKRQSLSRMAECGQSLSKINDRLLQLNDDRYRYEINKLYTYLEELEAVQERIENSFEDPADSSASAELVAEPPEPQMKSNQVTKHSTVTDLPRKSHATTPMSSEQQYPSPASAAGSKRKPSTQPRQTMDLDLDDICGQWAVHSSVFPHFELESDLQEH